LRSAAAADGDAAPSAPRGPRNDPKTLVLAFGISARGRIASAREPPRGAASDLPYPRRAFKGGRENKTGTKKK